MDGDFFVHQRLGQCRRVLLVVTQLAKAHDVDHHIFAECHAVFERQLRGQDHGLRVIPVHVQHGGLNHLHDICAKNAGAHVARVGCGEANLVVDDDVYRAARGVTPGLRQCQRFLVDTLTTECGVAVHQYGQHLFTHGVSPTVHAGTHGAFHHGIHDFKVRRVECQ